MKVMVIKGVEMSHQTEEAELLLIAGSNGDNGWCNIVPNEKDLSLISHEDIVDLGYSALWAIANVVADIRGVDFATVAKEMIDDLPRQLFGVDGEENEEDEGE